MSSVHDYIWKVIMGGEGGCGKTTLLYRFIHGTFIEDTKLTVGVQFHTQNLERQDRKISLVLWDLGGQERFRFIQGEYIRGAVGAFVLFDMSRFMTLEQARSWIDLIRTNAGPSAPIVLVGSKLDLVPDPQEQQSIMDAANQVVQEYGLQAFIPTSSKDNINVTETIYYLVDVLLYQAYYSEHPEAL